LPNLLRRVGTALVLLAILCAALFLLPRAGVAALMALIIGIGGYEWARLCGTSAGVARVYAAGIVAALAALFAVPLYGPPLYVAALFWLVAAPAWLWLGVKRAHTPTLLGAGFVVLVPAALAVVMLKPLEALLVLLVVWIADTAAYFAGRRWGRRKLAPSISPGKTWEGAAGAVVGAGAYAIILAAITGGGIRGMAVLAAGAAVLVLVSIAGDLFESAVKRQAGVKDSGTILPGHGGMLDRIDSATATLPVAAAMLLLARLGK
jgi:phosphatidate cytidylyltransferase